MYNENIEKRNIRMKIDVWNIYDMVLDLDINDKK